MSDCGCAGHYHNGGCSDQNPVFWYGAPNGAPVNPTPDEIADQRERRRNMVRDLCATAITEDLLP
jgi:hypothetical protein